MEVAFEVNARNARRLFDTSDVAGNRTRMRRETSAGSEFNSTYYSYAADNSMLRRREQFSGIDTYFYYDANGALTEMVDGVDATYFTYGANHLIRRIEIPGHSVSFFYDGRLNRYKIFRSDFDIASERNLLWDGLNCLEERDQSGALLARYTYGYSSIYGIGSCVEIYVPGAPDKTYTLIMDHRGTAHVLLDETGAETGRRYYDAFGEILGETGTWPVDLGYQTNWQTIQIGNKWWGLSKYRLYDPSTGVFTSRDFLNYPNKYRAFSNNPVGQVDRDGLADANSDDSAAGNRPKLSAEAEAAIDKVFASVKGGEPLPKNFGTPKGFQEWYEKEPYLESSGYAGPVSDFAIYFKLPHMDAVGYDLFTRWLNGKQTKTLKVDDEKHWNNYIKKHEGMRNAVLTELKHDLSTRNYGTSDVSFAYRYDFENGIETGYNLLHGSNPDIKVTGTACVSDVDGVKTVVYDLKITWYDIIDPNFQYGADRYWYNEILAWGYKPCNYNIEVTWRVRASLDSSGNGSGYPVQPISGAGTGATSTQRRW